MTKPFAHLHCHTHYSLLDGANRIPDLVKKTKEQGMSALAITDHGNLYGALEFYSACKNEEINPIIGYEAYIAPGARTDRSATRMKEASFHLTLLAMNQTGFKNLIKMASTAYLEGFYYKPRIDKELLEAHSEGLICLTGCAASELSQLILCDKMGDAKKLVAWYQKVFGDRVYMEIQNCGLEIQKLCADGTIDLANEMGLPLVATNDAHYLNREDASAHDVLLCVNTRTVLNAENRMKMEGEEFFVRTPDEMYAAFPGREDAVARTQEIADGVDIDLNLNARHFPVFYPPNNKTDVEYLRELCEDGLKWRYGDEITGDHRHRLNTELDVISQMGYSSYFLIVWDFVRFAAEKKIPCQARGSACGAIVAYLLGLSNVCPLKYDLLFERFLDPNRSEPPDIDIDFCRDGRQLVIDYTKEKYGAQNVAQIGTFGTMKAKLAIRDVARVLEVPLHEVDQVAKMVPDTLNISLEQSLEDSPELKEAYEQKPEIKQVIDIGMRIEGLARSAGTHAAGVVVADEPLDNYVPLQKISGKQDVITQWDGPTVEKAGLLKMDFLGLRNLTILDKAVQNVKKHRGIEIDPIQLPLDDLETFELLQRGETKGIFQLESGGMRDLLTKMKPDSFNDIIATSALYRPGPLEGGMVMTYVDVKHGRMPTPKMHPVVDEVLEETYGVMVYQEQVMRILNRLGGIELTSAYACIKAISKKKLPMIARYREEFLAGAKERNLNEDKAVELFEMIEKFAGYGFNKSHSTAYAAVAYQTAYLKAHFPQEFMAALLSCGMESSDRIAEHVDDCRRMQITVLPPDVNRSDVEFSVCTVTDHAHGNGSNGNANGKHTSTRNGMVKAHIAYGLGAIKGVGDQAVQTIVQERQQNGPYKNIFDLAERVGPKALNRSALEILIKAGALDSFGANREQHMSAIERAIQSATSSFRDRQRGQKSLFGGDDSAAEADILVNLPAAPDWTQTQKLAGEKDVFGFYLTTHPLTQHETELKRFSTATINELAQLPEKATVTLGGMITAIKTATTKKPNKNGLSRYVNFDLETTSGIIRCVMWPNEYDMFSELVKDEQIRFVSGQVERRGREPNLMVSEMLTNEQAIKKFTNQLAIQFQQGLHSEDDMQRVRDVLRRHPGKTEVIIVVDTARKQSQHSHLRYVLSTNHELRVSCGADLNAELCSIVGADHFELYGNSRKTYINN